MLRSARLRPFIGVCFASTAATYPRLHNAPKFTVKSFSETWERKPDDATRVIFYTKESLTDGKSGSKYSNGAWLGSQFLKDFRAKPGECLVHYDSGAKTRYVIVGLGETADVTDDTIRSATSAAVKRLQQLKLTSAEFLVPHLGDRYIEPTRALVQSAALSTYRFDAYFTEKDREDRDTTLQDVTLITLAATPDLPKVAAAVEETRTICEGTAFARDLANERSDVVTPQFLEDVARGVAEAHGMRVTVLDASELRRRGLNMLASVGQGARVPPRLVLLEYNKATPESKKLALVGKGITFDTGGLNLKPTGAIEDMHLDMSGAAAVLGTLQSVARLGLPVNVVGVLALAENAISSLAYKPHSILRSFKGDTVEVANTDAEGRLCLADALSFVQKEHKPNTVIDVATLTGACVVALGEYLAGLFSNNDALAEALSKAGTDTFERTWRMPIAKEHSKELEGSFSTLRSTGKARWGGACTAAAFLKHFIEKDVAWAHLDIAGPAMYSEARGFMNKGGTGFGVQLLTEYVKKSHVAQQPAADAAKPV